VTKPALARRHATPVPGLLMRSAVQRLAGAAALVALLWLGVIWALR
jgi:hypothetical protein